MKILVLNGSPKKKSDTFRLTDAFLRGLNKEKDSLLLSRINDGDCVYFVHSYHAADCDESKVAFVEYGGEITAAAAHKNVLGCQFHPEKSASVGLRILKSFCEMKEGDLC